MQTAKDELLRAIELNPNLSLAHQYYGFLLEMDRRTLEQAKAEYELARQLDPFSLQARIVLSDCYWLLGNYDKAVAEANSILTIDPNNAEAHAHISDFYLAEKRYDHAVAEYEQFLTAAGDADHAAAIERSYRQAGYEGMLRKRIEMGKQHCPDCDMEDIAECYAVLGDNDEAFFWLNKGYEERQAGVYYLGVIPLFDNLRSDPRYADLLRRMGLPQ